MPSSISVPWELARTGFVDGWPRPAWASTLGTGHPAPSNGLGAN